MAEDVGADQLAIIRIEGMHCHKCELAIQKALMQHPGVHEVEVDFNSKQASVLYDHNKVNVKTLTDAANRITSDVDPYDHQFITGQRTPESFYHTNDGIDQAISPGLA